MITITWQPANVTVTQGAISGSLAVSAMVTEGATRSYQWFRNTTNSAIGGTAIPGATNAVFPIPTDLVAGTHFFYAVVSATGGAAPVTSQVAVVTVTGAGGTTPGNQAALQALVNQKLERDGSNYTNATWREIAQVLEDAQEIFTNPNATQAEIDAVYTALRAAGTELAPIASFRNPFDDVAGGSWYFDAVMYAYANRLMGGTTTTTFVPGGTLSRAMVVTVLYRMEGSPDVTFAPTFDDVPAGAWYSEAVIWASQNEIVQGVGVGRFAPGDNITREQLATMLYRYARFKGYDRNVPASASLGAFADYGDVSGWALEAIRWAVYHELIRGSGNYLMPDGTATRAQYATILQRLIDRFEFGR